MVINTGFTFVYRDNERTGVHRLVLLLVNVDLDQRVDHTLYILRELQ